MALKGKQRDAFADHPEVMSSHTILRLHPRDCIARSMYEQFDFSWLKGRV